MKTLHYILILTGLAFVSYVAKAQDVKTDSGKIQTQIISEKIFSNDVNPLIIFDGRIISSEKMKSINPDSIQSVNVLKGDAAKALYGEPGENGVVLIKSKEKPSDDTAIKQINTSDSIFESVEMDAWFPKGDEGWMRFINKNLRTNVPIKNHAPAGSYKVSVSFFVEKDGTISELSIDENPGYGAAEEFVRVLKKSPKWVPGQQNGKIVKCRKRQTIIFQVTEE